MPQEDQQIRHRLDESGRPTDIAGRFHLRRPAVRDQIIEADSTDGSRFVLGGSPRVEKGEVEPTVLGRAALQLVAVDPILGSAYGVDETERCCTDTVPTANHSWW